MRLLRRSDSQQYRTNVGAGSMEIERSRHGDLPGMGGATACSYAEGEKTPSKMRAGNNKLKPSRWDGITGQSV